MTSSKTGKAQVVTHTNRFGDVYYLHEGVTKLGKPRYYFARKVGETAIARVPYGFEIAESINGVVSLRRTSDEPGPAVADVEALRAEVGRHGHLKYHRVEPLGDGIVIYAPDTDPEALRESAMRMAALASRADAFVRERIARTRYSPVMQFVIVPEGYAVHRMTYRGDGGWSWELERGPLRKIAGRFIAAIGTEKFFDLV